MNNPKIYLCFMATEGDLGEIVELVEPIKQYFNGVCTLLHDCDDHSPETEYLLKVNHELGGGNIIFGTYTGRHEHSRNRILYETGIKEGDFMVILDTKERVAEDFAKSLHKLIDLMLNGNIDIIAYYSKPYLVRFREDMFYYGTPHEGLMGNRALNRVEYNQIEPDENKVRINTRPLKRPPTHFINHYVRYLLLPNSNQNYLGLEHHGGQEVLSKLEFIRKDLVALLKENELDRTTDGVKQLFSGSLNDRMRFILNNHKQINDFYRYYILKDETVTDSHTQGAWDNIPKF